jgi:hypothetical protein
MKHIAKTSTTQFFITNKQPETQHPYKQNTTFGHYEYVDKNLYFRLDDELIDE